jgi:hypothetical protein
MRAALCWERMVHFREVQQFRQPWLWIVLLATFAPLVWSFYVLRQHGSPLSRNPVAMAGLLLPSCILLLIAVWFYMVKLVTEVDDREVRAQFVLLWRPRHIPFTEIREVKAVTYRPIREYGGWGIRKGRNGWAYNVSGDRGVRVLHRDGSTFLIGSQRAEELEQAIRARLLN